MKPRLIATQYPTFCNWIPCMPHFYRSLKESTIKSDLPREEAVNVSVAGANTQLYAEIKDPSFNPTRNVAVPATDLTSHQYEELIFKATKSDGNYQLTQNEAYGTII